MEKTKFGMNEFLKAAKSGSDLKGSFVKGFQDLV